MKKNKLIALAIITIVFIGPFRFAFMQVDHNKPMFTLAMFLLTVAGSLVAMFTGMKDSK